MENIERDHVPCCLRFIPSLTPFSELFPFQTVVGTMGALGPSSVICLWRWRRGSQEEKQLSGIVSGLAAPKNTMRCGECESTTGLARHDLI